VTEFCRRDYKKVILACMITVVVVVVVVALVVVVIVMPAATVPGKRNYGCFWCDIFTGQQTVLLSPNQKCQGTGWIT